MNQEKHDYPYFPDYSDGSRETNGIAPDSETNVVYERGEPETPETDYDGQSSHQANDGREMADKVGNQNVETGIPQNLSQGKSKGTKMLVLVGIGLLGFGICVAGLMMFLGRANQDDVVKKPETKDMIANNKKKDFSKEELDLGASEPVVQTQTASDAEMESGSEPDVQQQTEVAAASEPQTTPYDRKRTGNVLVDSAGDTAQAVSGSLNGGSSQNGAITGLSPDEMAGLNAGSDTSGGNADFGNRLNPMQTVSAKALQRGDLTYLLPKGTNIACTLETKIITTLPGFTRCLVMKDVYSADGKVLLLERGSKIVGEQTSAMLQGQARVFVLWNEAETPTGVKISLASPAAGQLGEAGAGARVKHHFWKRFGGAIMISLIGDLGDFAANRKNGNGNGQTFNFDNTSQSAQDMATEALKNSINIPPTGYVNQGSIINIMVARDVDFSGVYRRVDTRQIPAVPVREGTRIRQ